MHDERDSRLDRAIDEIAASLTRGEPSAAMRTSIRSRVEAGGWSRRSVPRWYVGLAAAGAVLVVIALLWPERETEEGVVSSGIVSTVPEAPPAPEVAVDPNVDSAPPLAAVPRDSATRRAAAPVPVETLNIVPLGLAPLEIPLIVVDGLSVDPLVLQQ